MPSPGSIDILKQALLLEQRGHALYTRAAETATDPAVKAFFAAMADEETSHIEVLRNQFKAYRETARFTTPDPGDEAGDVATRVISSDLIGRMTAAGFEAAAIQAAIAMEEQAVRLYAERAKAAPDAAERQVYRWLSDWERSHLKMLLDLDKALTESIWHDNRFWPF